jgi:hypothetical protein
MSKRKYDSAKQRVARLHTEFDQLKAQLEGQVKSLDQARGDLVTEIKSAEGVPVQQKAEAENKDPLAQFASADIDFGAQPVPFCVFVSVFVVCTHAFACFAHMHLRVIYTHTHALCMYVLHIYMCVCVCIYGERASEREREHVHMHMYTRACTFMHARARACIKVRAAKHIHERVHSLMAWWCVARGVSGGLSLFPPFTPFFSQTHSLAIPNTTITTTNTHTTTTRCVALGEYIYIYIIHTYIYVYIYIYIY